MERAKVRARTREGDRKQRAESGGKEGSGGGDGEGDGGSPSSKGKQQGGGLSFASGRVDEKLKSKVVGPTESGSRVQSGPSTLSYRGKLLSPGCAGSLVKHSEEDDIMQGWKDYFHKMNEKDVSCDLEESEKEETQEARRLEGKPGTLKFSAEEYSAWCLPWMNSLIIKVLGASFPTYIIWDRINGMWRPRDPLKLIPLNNEYYIVSFSNKEDKEYAFQEGPWMIEDHYLIVQRWRPNFNPWKEDLKCNIAAWIRLPNVPFDFYNVESLRRIGNMVGKMIKVDRSTSIYDKGGFARICVEIDLKQPLIPTYMVFREERHIIYEGLHQVCLECGKYRHIKQECPSIQVEKSDKADDKHDMASGLGDGGDNNLEKETQVVGFGSTSMKDIRINGGTGVTTGDEGDGVSPFGKLRILRRDFSGAINSDGIRKGNNGFVAQDMAKELMENRIPSQRLKSRRTVMAGSDLNKKGVVNVGESKKSEWVQVGSKRKGTSKGELKGKENKAPIRGGDASKMHVGQDMEPTNFNDNPFNVLQLVEPNRAVLVDP
ncbi:hypothetical protein K1719_028276 [Acacia pycnantha]|nr:hypothetical protein K1719_028276 [Acacia pycnantha]